MVFPEKVNQCFYLNICLEKALKSIIFRDTGFYCCCCCVLNGSFFDRKWECRVLFFFSFLVFIDKETFVTFEIYENQILKTWSIWTNFSQLICLLRNLYVGQEATVRTGHTTADWFQIGKGVRQGCILSPCLFNLYAEYIMRNAGLDEAQAGNKNYGASWWKWKWRVKKLA